MANRLFSRSSLSDNVEVYDPTGIANQRQERTFRCRTERTSRGRRETRLSPKPNVDWGLYLVATPELCLNRPVEWVVAEAVAGGASVVQLRMKNCTTREYVEQAEVVHRVCVESGVPLIINDSADVALAVDAEGLHVGQTDVSVDAAREMLGEERIIGLSVESFEDVEGAEKTTADYFGVSPIHTTPTKTDTKSAWGIEGLRKLRGMTKHVLIAVGGLNATNAGKMMRAGADGIAVVSAICSAPNPKHAAAELREIVEKNRMRYTIRRTAP
jgi:thiamine-phosphate pyrophosphorylase